MTKTKAFFKALIWFISCAVFSVCSVWLIITSANLFQGEGRFGHIEDMSHELAVFVSIALMAGAASDFVLSALEKTTLKWLIGIIVVLCVVIVFFLLNPKVPKAENVVNYFTYIFCSITLIYCLIVKSIVFHHEIYLTNRNKKCT